MLCPIPCHHNLCKMVNGPMNTPPHEGQTKIYPSLFNLAALALVLLLAGIGLAYWLNSAKSLSSLPLKSVFSEPFVSKALGSTELKIPQQWFSDPENINLDADFVDLKLIVQFTTEAKPTPIRLHLAISQNTRPSSRLLDSVYALRFKSDEIRGVRGLVGKPLKPEDGFENETVWYDPISTDPFVAKCLDLGADSAPPLCIRTVQISPSLILTYQFYADQLVHWQKFDTIMEPFLAQIGAINL